MAIIRKIAVGPNYKDAMHYEVGQPVIGGSHIIHAIRKEEDGSITIWVENNKNEIFFWKDFTTTMPVSTEYNINF